MMMFMWLFWLLVAAAIVWFAYRASSGWRGGEQPPRRESPEEILKARYARGEIDRETYGRMLDDLRGGRPTDLP